MDLPTLMASPGESPHQILLHRGSGRPSSCRMALARWCIRSWVIRWAGHTCLLTFEPDEYPRRTSERRHAFSSSWIPTFYCTKIFVISVKRKEKAKAKCENRFKFLTFPLSQHFCWPLKLVKIEIPFSKRVRHIQPLEWEEKDRKGMKWTFWSKGSENGSKDELMPKAIMEKFN